MHAQTQLPKSKLIETAAEIVYRQGWNATGINQILGEAKVPKGSFYYYFQSKEDLGVAIVKYQGEKCEGLYKSTLLNDGLSGFQALEKFFEEEERLYRTTEWRWGCPVGSFSSEIADSNEKIVVACRQVFNRWHEVLVVALNRGKGDGSVTSPTDVQKLASQLIVVWEGALLMMKTYRGESELRVGMELIKQLLRPVRS